MAIMAISAQYSEACAVKVIEVFQIALKTLRNTRKAQNAHVVIQS
jgi:hypothetical protein